MFFHKFRVPNASTVVLKVLGNVKYLSCVKWNVKKCVQVARVYYLTYILKELPYKSLVFCALMHINHCVSNKTKTTENDKKKWMKKTEHIVGHLIDCGVAIAGRKMESHRIQIHLDDNYLILMYKINKIDGTSLSKTLSRKGDKCEYETGLHSRKLMA